MAMPCITSGFHSHYYLLKIAMSVMDQHGVHHTRSSKDSRVLCYRILTKIMYQLSVAGNMQIKET